MENQSTRLFTRADVAAFFAKYWGKEEEPKCELKSVHVLPELTPPTWHIRYTSTWGQGTQREHTYYNDLIVMQSTYADGKPYLDIPTEDELPEGLASAVDEDTVILERKAEGFAEQLRQLGIEEELCQPE